MGLEVLETRLLLSGPGLIDVDPEITRPAFGGGTLEAVREIGPASHVATIAAPMAAEAAEAGGGFTPSVQPAILTVPPARVAQVIEGKAAPQWTISTNRSSLWAASPFGPEAADVPILMPAPPQTIRALPDRPGSVVAGTLDSDEQIELYHVPIHPSTRSVRVNVRVPFTADPEVFERVWLIDGSGEIVGHWSLARPGEGMSVVLESAGAPGADLFLGISRDATSTFGEIAPPAPFVLSIGLDDDPTSSPAHDPPPSDAQTSVAGLPWWLPVPDVGTASSLLFQDVPADDADAPGLGQEGMGSLPMRSSGPSAGVLADGRSVPPIGPLDGAVVDLTLIDVPADPSAPPPTEGSAIEGLAAIRPLGGFPMLASSGPRPRRDAFDAARFLTETPHADPGDPTPILAPTDPDRERSRRRPPLAMTLGVALAATFALLLPELAVRFTPESPKRPLPWARRKGLG